MPCIQAHHDADEHDVGAQVLHEQVVQACFPISMQRTLLCLWPPHGVKETNKLRQGLRDDHEWAGGRVGQGNRDKSRLVTVWPSSCQLMDDIKMTQTQLQYDSSGPHLFMQG